MLLTKFGAVKVWMQTTPRVWESCLVYSDTQLASHWELNYLIDFFLLAKVLLVAQVPSWFVGPIFQFFSLPSTAAPQELVEKRESLVWVERLAVLCHFNCCCKFFASQKFNPLNKFGYYRLSLYCLKMHIYFSSSKT